MLGLLLFHQVLDDGLIMVSQWKSYLTPFSHYYYHYYQTWKFKEEKNIRLKVDHPLILFLSNQKVNQQKK